MLKFLIPLLLFIVMAVFLALGLKLNPRDIPSPLIDKTAPVFSQPQLYNPDQKLSLEDMEGKVWMMNVWASWCVSCRSEHPLLNYMSQQTSAPIIGLNYKDEADAAKQWLEQLGNPYQISITDIEGRTGIDWGVYGVPETFVMDKHNIVRYKHTGPVTEQDVREKFLPLLKQLEAET